jgi:hypothetical protein
MPQKTLHYKHRLNAIVVLPKFVTEDFKSNDQRAFVGKTEDNAVITVFPESFYVTITGTRQKLAYWYKLIENALEGIDTIGSIEDYIDPDIVKGTRKYIEAVVNQINGSFKIEAYDATAVLIRRLTETLIIELFEAKQIDHTIKNTAGDFVCLSDLVAATVAQSDAPGGCWNLAKPVKRALPDLKQVGDLSAHNRRYLARKTDILKLQSHVRIVTEELITLAGF